METCTRLLRNAFEKFVRADNGTDRDAIEFMCENWPNNFMLQNREDTAGLELSESRQQNSSTTDLRTET
jgi:hypothetical protein